MIHLLSFGNDKTIALPADSALGDTHQRQLKYASILTSYHYVTLAPPHLVGSTQQLASNFTVYPVASGMGRYLRTAVQTGRHLIDTQPINVVSAQDPFFTGLAAYLTAKRQNLPLNLQFAADMVDNPYWLKQRPLNKLMNILGHWLIKRADSFRVVSEKEKQKLIGLGIPTNRIWNLGWISDFDRFLNANGRAAREKYLPSTHKRLLLFVGRLGAQKNLATLLKAFQQINQKHPDTYLLLAGDGPEKAQLVQLAQQLGISQHVQFAGLIPYEKIPSLFAAADVFVLSSIYEGNARVLAEAAATGKPVVSTDVSGASDTIINGESGYIVPVGDADLFTQRVCDLFTHPETATQMGQAAQKHILRLYNSDRILAGFIDLWTNTSR
ncbi:MAG: glycosyltransferase family 4 protein [Chloroflexi bacterium]|nr:glycosyltransferase family 4 protein [Chloroflexota bacterium]